tara:strand:- start:256 stop:495 length:240 start_codon:yes stop_codon:yes gene_type:complete
MNQDIRNILTKMVHTELDWEEELPTGSLAEQLDSIQRLSLMVAIEDHFEVIFSPEDDEKVDTIDDLIQLIKEKTNANAN